MARRGHCWGGNPDNIPCARRGAMAVLWQTPFFLARMDTIVCWQGGGCGNNGGSNVLVLTVAIAGSGQLKESGWEEEEDTVTRRW